VTREIAARWRAISDEERQQYDAAAAADLKRYSAKCEAATS